MVATAAAVEKDVSPRPKIGGQHIRSILRQARNSGYILNTAINELIDYPIKNAKNIKCELTFDSDGKSDTFKISDDCKNGYENILESGPANPFNMGHIKESHNDDDDISEFGTGTKQAQMTLGEKTTTYTQVDAKFYKVIMIYDDMAKKSIEECYEPTEFIEITEEEYRNFHPFKYGSRTICENIREEMQMNLSQERTTSELQNSCENFYGILIDKSNINFTFNGKKLGLPLDYFKEKECKPFNITSKIYVFHCENKHIIFEHNKCSNKYRKWDTNSYIKSSFKEFKSYLVKSPPYYGS